MCVEFVFQIRGEFSTCTNKADIHPGITGHKCCVWGEDAPCPFYPEMMTSLFSVPSHALRMTSQWVKPLLGPFRLLLVFSYRGLFPSLQWNPKARPDITPSGPSDVGCAGTQMLPHYTEFSPSWNLGLEKCRTQMSGPKLTLRNPDSSTWPTAIPALPMKYWRQSSPRQPQHQLWRIFPGLRGSTISTPKAVPWASKRKLQHPGSEGCVRGPGCQQDGAAWKDAPEWVPV